MIVRDAAAIRAGLDSAGDEPLMLAGQLPGVCVLTCPDRYRAGTLAERELGATVHVLDDGFQHLQLDRDIDLVIVGREDIAHPVTLPGGRLREPLDTLVAADAVLVEEGVVIESAGFDLPVTETIEFQPDAAGCRLRLNEQGVYLDGRDAPGRHEGGWQAMLQQLGPYLGGRTAAVGLAVGEGAE